MLCLAAHPDDEDGATLAYYSKLKGVNAYTIFFTRGEGGQNEIGPELYDELGKLREQECYDAAEIQGSKAYFLGFLDFGYSKTAKETFKFWGGKDTVLERLVYMIRVIRPDVIITNHDTITTKPNRQHGHHQVVGITAYDAFEKAADPNYHPEQFHDGITPWQVKKLFFRVYDSTKTEGIVTIDIQQKDPPSGKTIEDISLEALAKHRTQGMDKLDRSNLPFPFRTRRYDLIRSDKNYPFDPNDLFSGIEPDTLAKPVFPPQSFVTIYNYVRINPDDSLRLLKSVKFDVNRVGLVKTYDNTIESIFKAFKVPYDTLTTLDLKAGDLSQYRTIILDLRTYFYRPDVVRYNQRLLEYVENGGNLICFYNKPSDWNGKNYAPYPIYLTNERVTEEDAAVIISSHARVFSFPNPMMRNDWQGWVQERSIYLPSNSTRETSWRYSRLLDMDDEGEDQPPTSLLYAEYGEGFYFYVALALYRQLRVFNEGALKLFLNLISHKRLGIENIY